MDTSSNPNLDGDFVALAQELKRKKETRSIKSVAVVPLEIITPDYTLSNESRSEAASLKKTLLHCVHRDDVEGVRNVFAKISEAGLSLNDADLRDEQSEANALHTSLENNSGRVTRWFIESDDLPFMTAAYNVTVRNVVTHKTALLLLIEKDDADVIELLLAHLASLLGNDVASLLEYLGRTVLTELDGQRPRHMSAIHLAALKGNTNLVKRLVDLKVSVNSTNNKHDTPMLWASRGDHIETVRALISLGGDVNMQNDKGSTPLYWAVRYGLDRLLRVLIQDGQARVDHRRKLGLVSPIVLAAALGYLDILNTLIDFGGQVNTRITGGQSALHHAAMNGHTDVIAVLVKRGADVTQADNDGNTALMFAAKNGHLDAIAMLVRDGGNLDAINRNGQTVWDYAMESDDESLLLTLIRTRSQVLGSATPAQCFVRMARTPLHVAAARGDCRKLKCLLDVGVNAKSVDEDGNTYFHVAARENQLDVLKEFIQVADVDRPNAAGETALHLAARYGNASAVRLLLQRAKLDARNASGETPLHLAARSAADAAPDVASTLVDAIVKTHSWELVDASDNRGDTALHAAARAARHDVVVPLAPLNPTVVNEAGDNPLHVAASPGTPKGVLGSFLTAFHHAGRGLSVDQPNAMGESLLHICVGRGEPDTVATVIREGASLAMRDDLGHTPLHTLARRLAAQREDDDEVALLRIFETIVAHSTWWWCTYKELSYPDEQSEQHKQYRMDAMIHLTSELRTHTEELSVIGMAARLGAVSLLHAILGLQDVYRFQLPDGDFVFDVTNFMPKTLARRGIKKEKSIQSYDSSLASDIPDYESSHVVSILDIVTSMKDDLVATDILDIVSIRQLVSNYWNAYQWIFGLLMIAHLAFMSLFSWYTVTHMPIIYNQHVPIRTRSSAEGVFLIWPVCILLFQLYHIIISLYKSIKRHVFFSGRGRMRRSLRITRFICDGVLVLTAIYWPVRWFLGYLSNFTCVLFSVSVMAWYVARSTSSDAELYLLSLSLAIGWLYTIAFTKGFERVHSLSIMLKHVIVRDVTRFFVIYVFVLMAFGFALHVFFHFTPTTAEQYPSPWYTLFFTFNLLVGMGELGTNREFDEYYRQVGRSSTWVKIVYIFYMILATVVLLNLLIAMLSQTYSNVAAREGSTWRVGSIRLAMHMEHSMPFIYSLLKTINVIRHNVRYDPLRCRYMLDVSAKEVERSQRRTNANETLRQLQSLETRLAAMQHAHAELVRHVDSALHVATYSGLAAPIAKRWASKLATPGERPRTAKTARK